MKQWQYILQGQYRFGGDEEIYVRTGDTVFASRGSQHTFQNMGIRLARTLTTVVPGGINVFL